MSEELDLTALQIADEWADEAHVMMAEGLSVKPMDLDKVGAATALLNKAIALRGGTLGDDAEVSR